MKIRELLMFEDDVGATPNVAPTTTTPTSVQTPVQPTPSTPTPSTPTDPSHIGTFTTSKGSTYHAFDDNTTLRNMTYHPEHGPNGEVGIQPRSSQTFYVPPDKVNAWSNTQQPNGSYQQQGTFAATHQPALREVPGYEGHWGVQFQNGPNAGKWEAGSLVKPQTAPAVGLHPVEVWHNAQGQPGFNQIHFGNQIVSHTPNSPMTVTDVNNAGGLSAVAQRNAATGQPANNWEAIKAGKYVPGAPPGTPSTARPVAPMRGGGGFIGDLDPMGNPVTKLGVGTHRQTRVD